METLVSVVQELSLARDLEQVTAIVRHAARVLTGADGATFVVREGDHCHYVDEEAIAPLWKGQRFPMEACISGWVMIHKTPAAIEDIYADVRIPAEVYRPTFVKSVAMVPIRKVDPLGAIGNYWATRHVATAEEIRLLQALADSTSVALENIRYIKEQRELSRQLAQAVRVRDDFLSAASHELRTPLTSLKLRSRIRAKALHMGDVSLLSSERFSKMLEDDGKQIDRLARLIDDMLDISLLNTGRFKLRREKADLCEIAKEVLDRAAQQIEASGVTVSIEAPDPVIGFWDAFRIEQVFTNLLMNALKYGARKPVGICVMREGDRARMSIADQGIGISPADQKRIFDQYERAIGVEEVSGLGLGLYIATQIIEAHEGTISVQSSPGQGSVFTIELPLNPNLEGT